MKTGLLLRKGEHTLASTGCAHDEASARARVGLQSASEEPHNHKDMSLVNQSPVGDNA